MSAPKIKLIILPGKGKVNHLCLMRHRGGGWWEVECMGSGKRCKAGTCAHTAGLGFKTPKTIRPIRQIPRTKQAA